MGVVAGESEARAGEGGVGGRSAEHPLDRHGVPCVPWGPLPGNTRNRRNGGPISPYIYIFFIINILYIYIQRGHSVCHMACSLCTLCSPETVYPLRVRFTMRGMTP